VGVLKNITNRVSSYGQGIKTGVSQGKRLLKNTSTSVQAKAKQVTSSEPISDLISMLHQIDLSPQPEVTKDMGKSLLLKVISSDQYRDFNMAAKNLVKVLIERKVNEDENSDNLSPKSLAKVTLEAGSNLLTKNLNFTVSKNSLVSEATDELLRAKNFKGSVTEQEAIAYVLRQSEVTSLSKYYEARVDYLKEAKKLLLGVRAELPKDENFLEHGGRILTTIDSTKNRVNKLISSNQVMKLLEEERSELPNGYKEAYMRIFDDILLDTSVVIDSYPIEKIRALLLNSIFKSSNNELEEDFTNRVKRMLEPIIRESGGSLSFENEEDKRKFMTLNHIGVILDVLKDMNEKVLDSYREVGIRLNGKALRKLDILSENLTDLSQGYKQGAWNLVKKT
jgi:hypothetical protein